MDTITIEGVPGYNGEYPLDITFFTNNELRLIKQESGVRAGELQEAFEAGDNDLLVCIAAIMLWRKNGNKPNMLPLWEADAGKFTFNMETVADEEEGDDESAPLPTEPEPDDTSGDSPPDDGETSNGTSENPESALRAIGVPG